jgi:glyoxylase-like metal-dependent hydrolase (beta-lactamase superfamily II)
MEIIEGIHRIDETSNNIAHSNVYLIINETELLVVDTGTGGNAKKIVDYIQKIGHQPSEVSTIILTHYHMDHAGSAKNLTDLTNAKIAASIEDTDFIAGKKPYPKPKNLLFRAVSSLIKPTPVEVDILLKEGSRIGNLTVVEIPGHTPGSIALLDAQRKALFVGDTLRFDGTKISGGPKQFGWNAEKENESIKKLAMLDFDVMLPGHGIVLKTNASKKVKEYLTFDKENNQP